MHRRRVVFSVTRDLYGQTISVSIQFKLALDVIVIDDINAKLDVKTS